jgi:hypothetical protein
MTGGIIILLIVLVLTVGFPNVRDYRLRENYQGKA